MQLSLWVLLTAAFVYANENQERRYKQPFVADALGNTLPPPSNVPASVGSPVNLLTPDRYEFYTFDESGELVKRLMTLEEIQAIVAAGEETEGLVTFANDNQPTIAFNFSQPPYTKVHSVVTNVQNVLKAQMEAHKNKPHMQPTLDTPDVSDTWSLILPSIFGNTGLDIIPDKTTGSYITPETDTLEIDRPMDDEGTLGKEGNNQLPSSSTQTTVDRLDTSSMVTTSTTTQKPTTFTTTVKPATTKRITKPVPSTVTKVINTTTFKPKVTTSSPVTDKLTLITIPTTKPLVANNTLNKQRPTFTTTIITSPAPSLASKTPITTTTIQVSSTERSQMATVVKDEIQTPTHVVATTERGDIQYERVSTFVPISTISILSEKVSKKPIETTKAPTTSVSDNKIFTSSTTSALSNSLHKLQTATSTEVPKITSQSMYSTLHENLETNNSTTITTQSISPSTTITYTQSMPYEGLIIQNTLKENEPSKNNSVIEDSESISPLFDVAQSISQIASDLGSAYRPMTTTGPKSESTKYNGVDLESKENIEMEIPTETESNNNSDHFIKISTIDPHDKTLNTTSFSKPTIDHNKNDLQTTTPTFTETVTTLDPVLSESMGDLLSQVVNETPNNNFDDESMLQKEENIITTERNIEVINSREEVEVTTDVSSSLIPTHASKEVNSYSSANVIKNREPISNGIKNQENDQILQNEKNNGTVIQNKENSVKFSAIVSNITNDKALLPNTTTEMIEVELNKNTKDSDQNENNKKLSTNKNQETITYKEEIKTPNSTLPTYKSETHSNNSNLLEKVYSSYQNNLSQNKNHKEKNQDTLPKVEEFKKKIQKVNIDDKELEGDRNNSWKLIPTVSPPKTHEVTKFTKDKPKTEGINPQESNSDKNIILDFSKENQGLELTTKDLGEDIIQFVELCNELAFRYWNDIIETVDKKRSFVFSPYAVTSMLAMIFMGARGATSGEMNDILKLDDMVTFNPHFTLKNISDSIETNPGSGIAVSAFIRELYSDRSKGKFLTFYKERAQHFYNGHVEEVNFKLISDVIRRRTNLLVKRFTWGKLVEYMKTNTIAMQPPLAAFSANILYTDCSGTSVDGRDGEMYFVVSPNVRQRRLVPVPAVVFKNNFLAGYDPVLDATAAALGNTNSIVSTLFVMPGQQGNIVHAEDLEDLEKRLLDSNPTIPAWNRLLRTLLPRVGLELQIPRFSHKSDFNISSTLKKMGLKDIFDADHADLGGLNGPSKDLYLSDMIQSNTFATCGEGVIGDQHHVEQYPEQQRRRSVRWINGWDEPRDYQRAFHDPHDVGEAMHLPLHLRPRQARLPARNAQPARLKFDRPFLFFVRHNPSGMILYVGRYNPRLLP